MFEAHFGTSMSYSNRNRLIPRDELGSCQRAEGTCGVPFVLKVITRGGCALIAWRMADSVFAFVATPEPGGFRSLAACCRICGTRSNCGGGGATSSPQRFP